MDTCDTTPTAPVPRPEAAGRSWADISLGITTSEARQIPKSLDMVFDAFAREAA